MLSSVARSAHSSGISVLRASSYRSSSSQSHPRAAIVLVARSARLVAAPPLISSSIGRTRGATARSIASASSSRFSAAGALSRPLPSSARVQNKGKTAAFPRRPLAMPPRASASSSSNDNNAPGRPLDLPPLPWIAAVAFGLGWLTLLAVAPGALPAGMRDFALSVLSVAGLGTVEGAQVVCAVAWGIHVLEGLYAAKVVTDAGADAKAAAWWFAWSFLVGFPAVMMAKASVENGKGRSD